MAKSLENLIEQEFKEVQTTREGLIAKRAEIDEQLSALDLRLRAAENYRATLEGRFTRPTQSPRKSRGPSTGRAPRGARAELREKILDTLRQFPDGLAAEGINQELEASDAKDKQRIANVLSLLKSEGLISQDQRRGPYKIAPAKKERVEAP